MATIRDVAREAGVSIATVSRVINHSPRVSDEARRRVEAAAKLLDYWPNSAARSLHTRRHNLLGILLPDLHGGFFSEIIRGIDEEARRAHFQILISSSHANSLAMLAAVRAMRGRIDCLIAMAPERESMETVTRTDHRFPVVLLNPFGNPSGFNSVAISNREGARALVSHLIETGHQRIAMLSGPQTNGDASERLEGYRDALNLAGIHPDPALVIVGDFREDSGYQLAERVLDLDPRPTAVFAANDQMAIGLVSALREAEIAVPESIAVAGFDDTMIAGYISPPLTTVRVDPHALGRAAVAMALKVISNPNDLSTTRELVPTTLVVRRSCGCSTNSAHQVRVSRRTRQPVSNSSSEPVNPAPGAGFETASWEEK
jgi:LacI family transcriptional regulator